MLRHRKSLVVAYLALLHILIYQLVYSSGGNAGPPAAPTTLYTPPRVVTDAVLRPLKASPEVSLSSKILLAPFFCFLLLRQQGLLAWAGPLAAEDTCFCWVLFAQGEVQRKLW